MRTTRIVIGLVVIGFLGGLAGGYAIWKPRENAKADLRELLARAGEAADRIESSNRDLASQVDALKGNAREAEALKSENQALKGRLDNAVAELQGRIAGLDNDVRELQSRLQQKEREIAEKEKANGRLRTDLAAARVQAQQGEQFKAKTEELRSRIAALEQENRELRSVIDNISEMTRKREGPQ
jgi:prefoldin subunit 5